MLQASLFIGETSLFELNLQGAAEIDAGKNFCTSGPGGGVNAAHVKTILDATSWHQSRGWLAMMTKLDYVSYPQLNKYCSEFADYSS